MLKIMCWDELEYAFFFFVKIEVLLALKLGFCCLLSAALLDRLFFIFFFNVLGFKILLLVVGGVKF